MFQSDQTLQPQLFAFTPRDLVAPNSDVWLYVDLFDSLDLLEFDATYVSQGQAAKEPKLMLRTIFYALTHGVVSANKLQEVCRNDNRFITLSGDLRPDRRTFDRFIKRHEKNFDTLFVEIVRLAQAMGLIKLGRVAIDGSKFKAAADKSMPYEKMSRAVEHITENLKKLREDLAQANAIEATELESALEHELCKQETRLQRIRAAKEQIEREFAAQITKDCKKKTRLPKACKALADSEALSLGNSAKFSFGYNVQAAVDEENQIVIAAEIHSSANDAQAFATMLDAAEKSCQARPQEVLADCGYQSLSNIKEAQARNITPTIAMGREYADLPEKSCEQVKEMASGEFVCLKGKILPVAAKKSDGYTTFKLNENFCDSCPFQTRCQFFGKSSHLHTLRFFPGYDM